MTGQLNISSGGLLVTGNVGIGTVNPNAALEVNGNIYLSSNLNFLLLGTNSAVNPYIQGDASGQKLYIGVNNGAAITIDSSKNIGIGTTNPSQKLYVAGGSFTVENTNTFTVTPNYAGTTGIPAGILVNSGNAANVTFIADAASGTANRGVNISAFSGSNWFRGLSYMNKSGTPDLILQQDGGNVGIGTTSPGNRLVVGDTSGVSTASIVAVNTTGNLGNCIEFGHTNGAGYRSTLGSHYSSGQPFLAFHAEAGTNINTFRTRGIAGSVITTNNGGALLFSRVTTASADNQSLTESMRIDASGNMYLGLTGNPSGWGSAIKYAIRQASASGYTGFVSFASGNDHAIAVGHDGTKGMVGVSYATGSYTPLTFQTGGTDRITIDTAGSVGINQTSPGTARLYVKGQGSSGFNTIFEDPVASGYCWIQIKATGGGSNSSWQIGTYQSGLQFYNDNNSAYRVFFGDNGNVGIGTTSPSTKLHLYESGTADVLLRLTSANGTYDPLIQFTGQGNDITAEGFEIWYDNDVGDVHLSTTYPNDGATIHFHTRTGASKSTSNERLTILGNGNVGIGDTTVPYKLDVNGDTGIRGANYLYLGHGAAGTNWTSRLRSSSGQFQVDVGSFRIADVGYTGTITWISGSTTGNVGIGTTNPSYKLQVGGATSIGGNFYAPYAYISGGAEINQQLYLNLNGNAFAEALAIGGGNGSSGGASVKWMSPFGDTAYVGHKQAILSGTGYDYTIFTTSGLGFGVVTNNRTNYDFYIAPSGNVGIGTTNPNVKLDVLGNVRVVGILTATSLVKSGGTSSQFLKADGSVDSSIYLTSYTETDTLNSVTNRGNTTSNSISVGILTATVVTAKDDLYTEWTLGSNGSSDYTFTGPGFTGSEFDPTIYLIRGKKYRFTNTMGAHPFRIQSTPNGSLGTQYNDGITNNDVLNGTLTWEVRHNAPSTLYYQCTAHAAMGGVIYILNEGTGGGSSQWVTTNAGINTTSNVGIATATPTSKLHVIGDVLVVGVVTATDFNSSSDAALKNNVRTIKDPLEKVMSIRGVNFEWKESCQSSAGVLAQEIEKIMPELVNESNDGIKSVNYNGLIGLLIEVVKEQQNQINELKSKLS